MIPLLILAALAVMGALQFAAPDVLSSPIFLAVLGVLSLGLDSWISSLLIKGKAKGINPQQVVWGISAIIALIAMWQAGVHIPVIGLLSPPVYVATWLALANGWAEATKLLYEVLLKRWLKAPEPIQPALPAGWPKQ